MSLADSDAEEEKEAAAAGEQQPEQELQGGARPPPLSEEEAFILARAEAEAPDFVCPLTRRIMRDAALASDGFSYERAAIEAHIRRCQAGAYGGMGLGWFTCRAAWGWGGAWFWARLYV